MEEIQTEQKRKRGRPRKIHIQENTTIQTPSSESPEKRKRGRPRIHDNPQEAKKNYDREYSKTQNFKDNVSRYRKNYSHENLPLTKLESGKFRCNVCKSIILYAVDYRKHVKTRRHIENCDSE